MVLLSKYPTLNRVLAIRLKELAIQNKDWLMQVGEAISGRSREKESKIRHLFEQLPSQLTTLFSPGTTRLARMQAVHNVKDYLRDGKIAIDLYSPASYFKYIKDADKLAQFINRWSSAGLGFISQDYLGDLDVRSGFGLVFILPQMYVKYVIPYGILYHLILGLEKEFPYLGSLKSRARYENEVLVILKESYYSAHLSSKEILGVVERQDGTGHFFTNYAINEGHLDGYPLFAERKVKLYEHFHRDLAYIR